MPPDEEVQPYELGPRYRELQEQARSLAESLTDHAAAADESDVIDPLMRESLATSGLAAVMVGNEYGGRFARVDSLAVTVVREQLAAVSGHLDSLFAMQG